jgi:hypothetical protein
MNTDLNKTSIPSSIDELIQNVEKHPDIYRHLQIFLSHEYTNDAPALGEEYLAVTKNGFAIYRIDDIDYQNGIINISLTDTTTYQAETYILDINDKNPKCIFLRWKDVKEMVFNECIRSDRNNDELLEFIE